MDIRTLKLSDLNPAKYNPRKELKPGDTEFEKLKRSIESFGYVELIVVNETTGFTVISGHQRLSVLKALGYDSVECIVVSLDATREKALNIAMNKISGEWDTKKLSNLLSDLKAEDFDVTLTGFDTSEIGLMLGVDDEIVQDIVPDANLDTEPICQPGDIWQLGRHRLLCGSSTDMSNVTRLMDGQKSKLLFTSPPYSDMREYNGGKDLSVESIAQFISCFEPFTALQAVNLGIQRILTFRLMRRLISKNCLSGLNHQNTSKRRRKKMTVTTETIITAASVITSLVVIIGAVFALFRWYLKQEKQDKDIKDIKEEQLILTMGVLACLKGLAEQGCDGPVTDAIKSIEAHINKQAHK